MCLFGVPFPIIALIFSIIGWLAHGILSPTFSPSWVAYLSDLVSKWEHFVLLKCDAYIV